MVYPYQVAVISVADTQCWAADFSAYFLNTDLTIHVQQWQKEYSRMVIMRHELYK
jgi:hypothetical protein